MTRRHPIVRSPLFWFLLAPVLLAAALLPCFFAAVIGVAYMNTVEIERRATAGDSDAQRVLGYGYQSGGLRTYSLGRIRRDRDKAVHWYTTAFRGGDATAGYQLARMYETDPGRPEPAQAVRWYRAAAEAGSPDAAARLGVVFRDGLLGQSADARQAARWRERATGATPAERRRPSPSVGRPAP